MKVKIVCRATAPFIRQLVSLILHSTNQLIHSAWAIRLAGFASLPLRSIPAQLTLHWFDFIKPTAACRCWPPFHFLSFVFCFIDSFRLVCLLWLVFPLAEPLAVPPPITAAGSKDSTTKPNSILKLRSSSFQLHFFSSAWREKKLDCWKRSWAAPFFSSSQSIFFVFFSLRSIAACRRH